MPSLARRDQFDQADPPPLHVISRCVRRTMLCGGAYEHRKHWIQQRLLLLSQHCAMGIAAYAVMSNHLHIVVIPRPGLVREWSDERIVRSALLVSQRLGPEGTPNAAVNEAAVQAKLHQPDYIAQWRKRLGNVSEFMRLLNEPIARLANKEDGVTGHFWEGRFKSIPLLDQAALFTCMAYVDLNPVRASIAANLEESAYTSIQDRLLSAMHHEAQLQRSSAAERERLHGATERNACLLPIDQCTGDPDDLHCWPTITEKDYLDLVQATGECIHPMKSGHLQPTQSLDSQQRQLLDRLDLQPDEWLATMRTPGSLLKRVLGGAEALRKETQRIGARWLQATCSLFTIRPSQLQT